MLNDEQILGYIPTVKVYKDKPPIRMVWLQQRHVLQVGRAVEAEVRAQYEELIRELVEALDEATTYTASAMWSPSMTNECKELVAKGRARLEGKP